MNCETRQAIGIDNVEYENSRYQFKPTDMLTYEIDNTNLPLLFPFHLESGDFMYQPILYVMPMRINMRYIEKVKRTTITPLFFDSRGFISKESVDLYHNNKKKRFELLKTSQTYYNDIKNHQIDGVQNVKQTTTIKGRNYIKAKRSVYGTNC